MSLKSLVAVLMTSAYLFVLSRGAV